MASTNRFNSPYSAALGGGGFLFEETDAILPLLQSENSDALLKDEIQYNRLLHMNAERTRSKAILEIRRRYNALPLPFWTEYQKMEEVDRKAALMYAILKTYKIVFDFHVNVTMPKWNSIAKKVELADLMIELDEISARDQFVDSWTDNTKRKIAGAYLTLLRRSGMSDKHGNLSQLQVDNPEFYLNGEGEPWFLEAALMPAYQIEELKKSAL
ncbi:BrxA family protein [uncultured Duncaniella sp.]|jgi:hypothetical protein|uniref:BrxA family protein n=1 Tax=uncultured Duncaniella sp. TaxID=2768039 RepID=UPI000F46C9A8|nr:BrxA family protein [uncultured Duncaniella sp.]ROT16604.1 DUF1819 family protein [Muribaculaceae bacterium Isolate-105 (HZI)]